MIWNINIHKEKFCITDNLRQKLVHKNLSLDDLEQIWFNQYPRNAQTEEMFIRSIKNVENIIKEEEKDSTLNKKLIEQI